MSKKLVPDCNDALSKFKNEVAKELGIQFSDYNGHLTARECGSVGGEMVKKMVESYEKNLKK
ncbi:MAG: alpha/beta-type small acid-soluble spore protein [Sarcina sp.]